jgi:hypothetical protein
MRRRTARSMVLCEYIVGTFDESPTAVLHGELCERGPQELTLKE